MAHTALRAHFPPANLIGHPPAISPNHGLQNEPHRDQLRLRSLETSHPPRQGAQINSLNILITFMKQRTYLITLHLFEHLARSLPTSERFEKDEHNLFCATPLRSRGT
jgi:hypothetical protein